MVDAPLEPLQGKTIAVLGYGNQGRAHALNLRDSGLNVIVGGRDGSMRVALAAQEGFASMTLAEAAARADLAIVALPDQVQPSAWVRWIEDALPVGAVVGFIHGFSIRFGFIEPRADLGVVLVAPKGPGATVRARYEEGLGIPALFAVQRENAANSARDFALAWGAGIGCARSGLIEASFAAEAESDLFGEQAVLCGGLLALVHESFALLVEAGYAPEVAYIECCHEVKQVADLLYARGPDGMRRAISDTAEFGAFVAESALVDDALRTKLRALLADIQSGAFARRFMQDHDAGHPQFQAWRRAASAHPIEGASARVRSLMPWLRET
ncbi:MAG: ketol-acid reductoisomerase [Planctomycetota bacterium]|jgi:ketol-acid reductoisomerase|nr:MAG: ketol-acid reductoisomerase [Planctomycetota bacterium]RLS96958.1 MAG: ketol-acid reductoisomerase [Planctomycetota bacterium]